jgi:hypothetical protein
MGTKKPLTALKSAIRVGAQEFMPPPVRVDAPLPSNVSADDVRVVHASLCKEKKVYFPLSFRGSEQVLLRFVIDHPTLAAVETYEFEADAPDETISFFSSLIPPIKEAMGATFQGRDGGDVVTYPLDQLDGSYHMLRDTQTLATLIDTVPGLDDMHVSSVVRERMRMARSMLSSYVTLAAREGVDMYTLGFIYGSFEIGTRYGMPILPKRPDAWQEAFGLPDAFSDIAARSYRYFLLDAYLSLLFPGMGLEMQEMLFSEFETYLAAIDDKTFGDVVPDEMLEHLDMTPREINKRVSKLESLYG